MQQHFNGAPQPQHETEDPIIWPEPNDLSGWWHRIMADGEQPTGKADDKHSWTR